MMKKNGFTLIELIVVIVILGVLAGLTMPRLAGRTRKAKIKAAETDIYGGISVALDLYDADVGEYPSTLTGLMQNTADSPDWDGPYVKHNLPRDPWGNEYIYAYPGDKNENGYDLSSKGPDRQEGTDDDITNWSANKS